MPIAKITVDVEIPHVQSLKDRRQVVRSMKDGLRHGFNISVAEMDEAVVLNRATFGVVAISGSRSYLSGLLEQIERTVYRIAVPTGAQILDIYAEFLEE
jgi:uncharacterized protein YlxP (DUF503 family)